MNRQDVNRKATSEAIRPAADGVPQHAAIKPAPIEDLYPGVNEVLKSPGRPLDVDTRAFMEPRFGHNFSQVRVHTDSRAAESARAVNSLAYTIGSDIVFGANLYSPELAHGRQLLAHELAHVVQQSGAMRTDPAPIVGEPHLEREADRMGNLAAMGGAFQRIQVSRSVPQNVMQCKKVPMDFGEFETTQFRAANSRGLEIKLQFAPNEGKVDAKKIALSQSVKAMKESGAAYATTPNLANRMVPSGKPGAGHTIDAPATTNNPIYYGTKNLGASEDLKDTPMSGNNPANPVQIGINTNYILGYCYREKPTDTQKKKQPASMDDMPQGRKKPGAGMDFETAAFAIEGADKGKYYGSVKWGYRIGGTDSAPTVTKTDIDEASRGKPTANFMEAAKLWNVGKTQGTLKVIADPAIVYRMDGSTTERLAKGTVLKQLDTVGGGVEPMIKAEVLNADGTGSGKLIYINVPDVKDMGDGSPNKKLPR